MTSDQPAAAFNLASLAVAGTVAVPDTANGVAVEWRVKRLSVAEATRAGLLSGVIGAAVSQAATGPTDASAPPAASQVESTLRALLESGERAVLASVTGVRLAGESAWTDCRIVGVGGEDAEAGRLSILSVSVPGQIEITKTALSQALEAVQSVSSFRAP